MRSPLPLKIVASSLDTLQPVMLDNFSSRADLIDCLKASANVPELAGPPRIVRGQRLVRQRYSDLRVKVVLLISI